MAFTKIGTVAFPNDHVQEGYLFRSADPTITHLGERRA
jgi:hypothetical protein